VSFEHVYTLTATSSVLDHKDKSAEDGVHLHSTIIFYTVSLVSYSRFEHGHWTKYCHCWTQIFFYSSEYQMQ